MEVPSESEKKKSSEAVKTASIGSVSSRKRVEARNITDSGSVTKRSGSGPVSSSSVPRRNSTGGLAQRSSLSLSSDGRTRTSIRDKTAASPSSASTSSVTEPVRRSLPEIRRSSISALHAGKPVATSPVGSSKTEVVKRPLSKPALSVSASFSSSRRVGSSTGDVSGGGTGGSVRKSVAKVSSPSMSARSPTLSGGLRAGSMSSSSDRSSSLSGRRKLGTPDSRNSRFIILPQIEVKANDDLVRLVVINAMMFIFRLLLKILLVKYLECFIDGWKFRFQEYRF